MTVLKHTLPYHHDSARLFEKIAHEPWAILLDSGQAVDEKTGEPGSQYGQYDILVARPIATLVTNGSVTNIQDGKPIISEEDPFALLNCLNGTQHRMLACHLQVARWVIFLMI